MPISSFDISAALGQGGFGQQGQGPTGLEGMTGVGAQQGMGVRAIAGMGTTALPAMATVAGIGLGLDPFSLSVGAFKRGAGVPLGTSLMSRGGMGAVRGAGGLRLGMGLAAGAGVGLAMYGAGKALGHGVEQITTGAARRARLGSFLGQQFGFQSGQGRGMQSQEVGQVSKELYSLAADMDRSVKEVTRNLGTMRQLGLMRNIQNVRQFRQVMKQTMGALNTISNEFGVSMQEAGQFLQGAQRAGFRGTANQMATLKGVRQAQWASGLNVGQVQQVMAGGTQLARAVGAQGWRGALGAQRGLVTMGAAQQAGIVSGGMMEEATGVAGPGAAAAFTGVAQRAMARRLSTKFGRYFMAAGAEGDMRRLDPSRMRDLLGGGYSMGDIKRMGRRAVYGRGRRGMDKRFLMYEEEMRGQLLQQGPRALAGMVRAEMGGKIHDFEDPSVNKAVRKAYGLSKRQAEAVLRMARKLPEMMAEEFRQEEVRLAQQSRGRTLSDVQKLGGAIRGWMRRNVNEPLQQVGGKLQQAFTKATGAIAKRLMDGAPDRQPVAKISRGFARTVLDMAGGGRAGMLAYMAERRGRTAGMPKFSEISQEEMTTSPRLEKMIQQYTQSGGGVSYTREHALRQIRKAGHDPVAMARRYGRMRAQTGRDVEAVQSGDIRRTWRTGGFASEGELSGALGAKGLREQMTKFARSPEAIQLGRRATGLAMMGAPVTAANIVARFARAQGGPMGEYLAKAKEGQLATRWSAATKEYRLGGTWAGAGTAGGLGSEDLTREITPGEGAKRFRTLTLSDEERSADERARARRRSQYHESTVKAIERRLGGPSEAQAAGAYETFMSNPGIVDIMDKGIFGNKEQRQEAKDKLGGWLATKAGPLQGSMYALGMNLLKALHDEPGGKEIEKWREARTKRWRETEGGRYRDITKGRMRELSFNRKDLDVLKRTGLLGTVRELQTKYKVGERLGGLREFYKQFGTLSKGEQTRIQRLMREQEGAGAEFSVGMGVMRGVSRELKGRRGETVLKGKQLRKVMSELGIGKEDLEAMEGMTTKEITKKYGKVTADAFADKEITAAEARDMGVTTAVKLGQRSVVGSATKTAAEEVLETGRGRGFGTTRGMHTELEKQSAYLKIVATKLAEGMKLSPAAERLLGGGVKKKESKTGDVVKW